jgi:superfamily I DNA/RNA helicase
MGLFGGGNKTNTTNNTYATQQSIGATDGSIIADGSSLDYSTRSAVDNSLDYKDQSDNSVRIYDSSQHFDASPEIVNAVIQFADNTNARNLQTTAALLDTGLDATREISNAALAASRDLASSARSYLSDTVSAVSRGNADVLDAISSSSERETSYLEKATTAIVNANRSDGEAVLSTVTDIGKFIALAIVGVAAASAFR